MLIAKALWKMISGGKKGRRKKEKDFCFLELRVLFLIKLVQFAWIKNNFDGLCEHVHTAALWFRRRPNQTRIKAHVCRASCGLLAPAVYRCRFNRSRDGSRAEGGGTASVSGRPNVSASVMRGRWGRDTLQMWSAFFFFLSPLKLFCHICLCLCW